MTNPAITHCVRRLRAAGDYYAQRRMIWRLRERYGWRFAAMVFRAFLGRGRA